MLKSTPFKNTYTPTHPDDYSLEKKFNVLGLSKLRLLRPVLLEEAEGIHK